MANYAVENPYPVILGTNGSGLNAGSVYIGVAGQDPETNPITVYWDEAGTNPASQPLTTIGGYIWNAGTPAQIYGPSEYSIRVRDRFGAQVFYDANVGGPLADFVASLATSAGAGLIGFDQTVAYDHGTLGGRAVDLPRSLKAAPYYAAAAADDTDAMLALAASSDTKIALNINSPTRISGAVNFADKNLTILGSGAASSEIRFSGAGGLTFNCSDTTGLPDNAHMLEVCGLSLIQNETRTAGNGPTAIEAEWSYTGSATVTRARFSDLEVRAAAPGKFWGTGIKLIDAAQVYMSNTKVYNQDGHQTNLANAAIEIVRDKASNVTGFFLENFWLGRFQNGILVSQAAASVGGGTVEGHYISNGEIVNAAYGIREDNTSVADAFYDSISINNIHMNTSRANFKAGRVRGLYVSGNHLFSQNFGETVSPAPLEAAFNILLQADGLRVLGNAITRYDTITNDVPCFLLPDAASLNWARIEDNQIANWLYLANVQSGGALTEVSSKLYIGPNTLILTPLLADYGFRGNKISVGGNGTAATGTAIDFGHEFNGAPAVNVSYRGPTSGIRAWPDAITATGFTLRHDGAGAQTFSWSAVGE